ncbi:unnamed protein product [Strongylus vulgaris]|uniref:Uncharacterized protein n=1 Tax=Strongylus vulgaris TaxID=40348 RepID=A0A3P7JFK3_STRVU|nr:unnamed protein product [Strongylus vulgaris]
MRLVKKLKNVQSSRRSLLSQVHPYLLHLLPLLLLHLHRHRHLHLHRHLRHRIRLHFP